MFDWTRSCKLRGRDLSFFCALIEESSTVVPTVNTSTIIHGGDRRATFSRIIIYGGDHRATFTNAKTPRHLSIAAGFGFCSSSKMISS